MGFLPTALLSITLLNLTILGILFPFLGISIVSTLFVVGSLLISLYTGVSIVTLVFEILSWVSETGVVWRGVSYSRKVEKKGKKVSWSTEREELDENGRKWTKVDDDAGEWTEDEDEDDCVDYCVD
ncbi:uncharacterized protein LY89DRAFT_746112 [Mollisia scopiformis]|uniref:Uncharacterized protein n=1 Tax=Mollisia scopiformis TaxID=149040 RepID=A0A194XCY3_MOLSC|nr:uncharacterized protein LY89DRAFT_746112 [Mollisia scopiformis]KUJ18035.1 hypothetical protein LY89DRAFT_746112 [Mollisia scopiformis]